MTFARLSPVVRASLALLLLVGVSGCDLVLGFIRGSPEKRLAQAVEEAWVSPGAPFVGGAYGRDTIASVESTGSRSWRVKIPAPGRLEGAQTWELEIEGVDVYRVFPSEEFAGFVRDRAMELDRRAALSREAWLLLSRGEVLAVGDVAAHVRRTDQAGSADVDQIAYLRGTSMRNGEWALEPETRTSIQLRNVLRVVYEDLALRDDRVHTCMESVDPTHVPRPVQLDCVGQVLAEQFGGE